MIRSTYFVLSLIFLFCTFSNNKFNSDILLEEKHDVFDMLECQSVDNLRLVIYYKSPSILTRSPWNVNTLIDNCDYKIEVEGEELNKYSYVFNQITNDILIAVDSPTYENIRIYYTIENKLNGKIIGIALWGGNGNSVFVNGVEMKANKVFYDVITPFLKDKSVKELEEWVEIHE